MSWRSRAHLGKRPAILAAVAVISLAAQSLPAQSMPTTDEGDIVFGQQKGGNEPTFWLAPIHGSLNLMGAYNRMHESAGGTGTTAQDTNFQETLTLSTNGYIMHPNIVDLRFSITGGLTQDYYKDDFGSNDTTGSIWGWDISATFMRTEPASATVYTRRSESTLNVPFGPTENVTDTEYGAIGTYRTTNTNSQIQVFHQEDDQSQFGLANPSYSQTRDVLTGYGDARLSSTNLLNWNFDIENDKYTQSGFNSSEQSINAGIGDVANFGDEGRNTLASALYYTDQRGTLESSEIRWLEHMHLWHNRDLESNYDYIYDEQSFGGTQSVNQFASADIRHQLYDSLATTGRFSWAESKSGDTSIDTYVANLQMNYEKKVPEGTLYADLLLARQWEDISGSGTLTVANQPVAFIGLDPIDLNKPNAVPSSVLLRDATTGRIYQEGIDYTVTSTPLGLQIDRVLGGNIAASQPLLLDYDYTPLNASEIVSNIFGIGTRYEITKGAMAGLTPYARFLGQNQQVSGGTAQPNDVRDYIIGATYAVGDLTLLVQREWYDSTLYPFDAWRGQAQYLHRFSDDTSLTGIAGWNETQYHQPSQHSDSYSLNAILSQRITTHLNISLYVTYAQVNSDPGGQTQGLEEGLEADWAYRDVRVYMKLRNSQLNSDISDQNFQFFQVGLTRSF